MQAARERERERERESEKGCGAHDMPNCHGLQVEFERSKAEAAKGHGSRSGLCPLSLVSQQMRSQSLVAHVSVSNLLSLACGRQCKAQLMRKS